MNHDGLTGREQCKKKILCVGLVVVDIVTVLQKYPEEDSKSR